MYEIIFQYLNESTFISGGYNTLREVVESNRDYVESDKVKAVTIKYNGYEGDREFSWSEAIRIVETNKMMQIFSTNFSKNIRSNNVIF